MVTPTRRAVCCEDQLTCEPCSRPVCEEHTLAIASCVDVGVHHLDCVDDCSACAAARARDVEQDHLDALWNGWK